MKIRDLFKSRLYFFLEKEKKFFSILFFSKNSINLKIDFFQTFVYVLEFNLNI